MTQIKAAGYIRVSSPEQVKEKIKNTNKFKDKISLDLQRERITEYAERHNLKLTQIYADEGISGGSVKERLGLQDCLHDGQKGKFTTLVVYRLSRFGRNARELLNNYEALQQTGIELISISEGIDFGSKYGKAFLGILAILMELENDIRRETMLESRIAQAYKGKPTSGRYPIGRKWNKETGEWELDMDVVAHIRFAATLILQEKSLYEIKELLEAKGWKTSETTLSRTLQSRCGTEWTVKFEEEDEPITYIVPEILDLDTIQRVRDQIQANIFNNRKDVKRYVLGGYLRCKVCGKALSGWSQMKGDKEYQYYYHPSHKKSGCRALMYSRLVGSAHWVKTLCDDGYLLIHALSPKCGTMPTHVCGKLV